mmetsp:Transcript_37467/g.38153  ORF Transcript_37467/g.38153 Transcript_37467/m.38153 type:complete len:249 (+) Transcript_37467:77-823(+)|eukprot:CAMPEP_0182416372 /NCGR_PEP_ID=MMETSP1167-20130531/651_1 /TAXON_ID=2988 /ORGANISM="Mallomonas Sp, Strain CCMP3275" /LENGTH=248 /DNA_ID=CAMNT_0024589075 /DNA_START=57 /DNA_END=803 /DNA_ORIENTATION=-
MIHSLRFLFIIVAISVSSAFLTATKRCQSSLIMSDSAVAAPPVKNIPRKIKRGLRSATAETFNSIYKPEYEEFLKNVASNDVNEDLRQKIQKTARKLGVAAKEDFGVKPAIVLNDIVDSAVSSGKFNTLVTAVQAAGLVDTLKGEGPFTVFAPSEAAFAALPEGTLDGLLADKDALSTTLQNHVVSGIYKSKKVMKMNGESLASLGGKDLAIKIDKKSGKCSFAGTDFSTTDIKCSNGMIHVINSVIM